LSQAAHAGDALYSGDREVGCVLDVIAAHERIVALVVLTDDVAAQAHDGWLDPLDGNLVMHLDASWQA
jgi:hypothetical protein